MNQFIQRIANYVANEVLIKGLANSKTFQRFALRSEAAMNDAKGKGRETVNEALDELHKTATEAAYSATSGGGAKAGMHPSAGGGRPLGPPKPPLTGFPGFVRAFGLEVRKDLGLGK